MYFGINPPFVAEGMNGRFSDTMVIMMGCESLSNSLMAQAFVGRGAMVYVGWHRPVTCDHTDAAVASLLSHLLNGGQTVKKSVQETLKDVGADPLFGSLLVYYPLDVGEQTIGTSDGGNWNSASADSTRSTKAYVSVSLLKRENRR